MSGTDTPEELEVDLGEGRGQTWAETCAETLQTDEGLKHMRIMLQRWKRKGGEGGTPGNYEKLFEKLNAILNDDDITEPLRKMLEGTNADDHQEFGVSFNSCEQEMKNDFMVMLNIIEWIPGEKGILDLGPTETAPPKSEDKPEELKNT